MPDALVVIPPTVIAVVLVASGVAKLRHPDDDGWAQLGVPAALRRGWLMRLHPIGELALAAALLLGGVAGALAAWATVVLFTAYLVLVWRAWRTTPDASCACFGARRPIGRRTVVRNAWLVIVAVIAAFAVPHAPAFGGIAALAAGQWAVIAGAGIAVATTMLVHDPADLPSSTQPDAVLAPAPADELSDYVRARTPAVFVSFADGTSVNLRELAASGPLLLLAVSETCVACRPVIDSVPAWRALLPELSVRFLLQLPPATSSMTDTDEPQTLHDPSMHVRDSIADWVTPTAVLIGMDGYLAGGPVTGADEIEDFIGDVYESLHGERPPRDG